MSENDTRHEEALEAARLRRVELKEAVSSVEIAVSSPVAGPEWRFNVQTELENMRIALEEHVEEVEREDGLLAQLTDAAPRLVNKINRVRDEHPELARQLTDAIASTKESTSPDEVRAEVMAVLLAIVRHRQSGADLVYEGYSVDIGGG